MARIVVLVAIDAEQWYGYTAMCGTGDCAWRFGPEPIKAAVEEQARWHRESHRRGDS